MKEKTSTFRTSAAMLRKIVWLLSALCLLFVFDARSDEPVEGENLIVNGDFEIPIADDNFGWENKQTISMNADGTEQAINGLTLRLAGPAAPRQIWQEVNVVPGQKYVIRFTGRIMNSNSASGADVNNHSEFGPATLSCIILVGEFNLDDELNRATELFAISTQSNTDTLVEGVFAIPQGITSITVKLYKDHNVGFVDDVELRTTTAEVTPIPAKNIVSDGSFESLTTAGEGGPVIFAAQGTMGAWLVPNWLPEDVFELNTASPQDGNQSLFFADGKEGPVKQGIELTEGKVYHASIWAKWSAGAVGKGKFKVDANQSEIGGVWLDGMETEWTEYTFEVTVSDVSGILHEVVVYRWAEDGVAPGGELEGELHFDNVVITEIGDAPSEHTLTVVIAGQGSVTVDGVTYTEPLVFETGKEVSLSAVAAEGWAFVAWSGDLESTEAAGTITMDSDKTITASFSSATTQNLLTNGSFEDLTTDEDGKITNLAAMGTFDAWAVPAWAQATIGLSDQTAHDGDKSIYFKPGSGAPIKQRVALTDGNQYHASVWVKWSEGADNKGDTQFKVDAQGEANTGGSQIAGVLLDGMETEWTEYTFEFTASGTSHEIVVFRWGADAENEPVGEMYVDNVVLTELEDAPAEHTLTVVIEGEGNVLVDGVAYTEPLVFETGKQVSLSAVAAEGWVFVAWSGDLESNDDAGAITMDSDKTITATFSSTTAVEGVLWENLIVYPNPFNNELRIDNAVDVTMVSIANLLGQVVFTKEIHDDHQFIINTSSLEKGVYLLRLTGNHGDIHTVKLIK